MTVRVTLNLQMDLVVERCSSFAFVSRAYSFFLPQWEKRALHSTLLCAPACLFERQQC